MESSSKEQQQVELAASIDADDANALWVFGYGSLCWRPGFRFEKAVVGHVRGFARRLWQGNATHRGTEAQPGRVATLVDADDDTSCVHGVAFAVAGESDALSYLARRECALGGYDARIATFHPAIADTPTPRLLKVVVYVATPANRLWLGAAPPAAIAAQVLGARGASGPNAEYVLRLAHFMRRHCPAAPDAHLFAVEARLREMAGARRLDLAALMGDGRGCLTFTTPNGFARPAPLSPSPPAPPVREPARDSFEFAARVPDKTLRCLNI